MKEKTGSIKELTERCAESGIITGKKIDLRTLKKLEDRYDLDIILYWEEERVKKADYQRDLAQFRNIPEENRPFIKIDKFLEFMSGMYAVFPKSLDELLEDIPIHVTIVAIKEGKERPVIYGLMPFLDEMEE